MSRRTVLIWWPVTRIARLEWRVSTGSHWAAVWVADNLFFAINTGDPPLPAVACRTGGSVAAPGGGRFTKRNIKHGRRDPNDCASKLRPNRAFRSTIAHRAYPWKECQMGADGRIFD